VVLAGLVAAVVLVAGRAVGGPPGAASGPAPPDAIDRYVVRPGDTLWEIARARVGAEADPRPFVDRIREASGLETSALQAGEVLLIPPGVEA
jgi:nucleoid-associated protein YgaU